MDALLEEREFFFYPQLEKRRRDLRIEVLKARREEEEEDYEEED